MTYQPPWRESPDKTPEDLLPEWERNFVPEVSTEPFVTTLDTLADGAPEIWVRVTRLDGIEYWELIAEDMRELLSENTETEDKT